MEPRRDRSARRLRPVQEAAVSETKIVPIRALSDDDALAWIMSRGRIETSGAALARDWDWTPSKVRRRLANWSAAGHIKVARGSKGRSVISPAVTPVAEPPAPPANAVVPVPVPPVPAIVDPPAAPALPAAPAMEHFALAPAAPAPARVGFVDVLAYLVAISLTATAAYFSIQGMIVLFPGAPTAIIVMGVAMEAAKLVTVAFLARQWRRFGVLSRAVLIVLVAGLAAINSAGVYSQLVAAHLSERVAASSSIESEAAALATRIEVQSHMVADFDIRLGQIDGAIGEMVRRGRSVVALEAMASQRKIRDALASQRQREADTLVNLKTQAGTVADRGRRAEVEAAPITYVAKLIGATTEQAIRMLILLMVLTCDPLALALTAAAARSKAH
jgi:hypothetical protein